MHQRTINAMKKRTPAINRALKHYNDLCARLATLRPARSTFPLPEPLSTDLKHLRNNEALMRDVYIAAGDTPAPAWLVDNDVRKGIRAIQTQDRCAEEEQRLTREWRNLCDWHANEMAAVEQAAAKPSSTLCFVALLASLTPRRYTLQAFTRA